MLGAAGHTHLLEPQPLKNPAQTLWTVAPTAESQQLSLEKHTEKGELISVSGLTQSILSTHIPKTAPWWSLPG